MCSSSKLCHETVRYDTLYYLSDEMRVRWRGIGLGNHKTYSYAFYFHSNLTLAITRCEATRDKITKVKH